MKIEKDSSGQKHLIQKFLKGDCSLEKVKEDLIKYNDEYHIETNKLLKSPQTTDIYVISQKKMVDIQHIYFHIIKKLQFYLYLHLKEIIAVTPPQVAQ